MRALFSFLVGIVCFGFAHAAEDSIPYLGPGSDKLSKEEYERIYKNYIKTSILLGYPFLKDPLPPCEQSLSMTFRQVGMYGYPVPSDAEQVKRTLKLIAGKGVEVYEMAGTLIQLVRNGKNGPLEQLMLVNSASTKATRRLSQFAKQEVLELKKDSVTGLEKVKGLPVGYPHLFFTSDSQGLYVKILKFNGRKDGCLPLTYVDNSWTGGFDLTEGRCTELKLDAEAVWSEKLSAEDFAARELKRMKDKAMANAIASGTKPDAAKALVDKHFAPPLTSEINVVGSAMRSLAQCNSLALGKNVKDSKMGSEPATDKDGKKSGAGSAE